ncbi:MAG: zinc ribbon domain-containing protein [Candidatus Methanomethylophilaceae archaeon]|nr:zinc ribbon domain-containing protein [Candidatus Methanomethylophilaceae archaeon]
MAYCRKCGEVIDDEAVFCPKCGVQQMPMRTEKVVNDDGSPLWAVIAFFIPVVGLVLWAAWHDDKPKCSRMAAYGTIASFAVIAIGCIALISLGSVHIHYGY